MLEQSEIQGKYKQAIVKHCLDRYNTYMNHDVHKSLMNRIKLIDDAIDRNFKENEAFIAEVAPPVVERDYRDTSAFLEKYFENDPITSFRPIGATPKANADNIQSLVHCNYITTRFRDDCLAHMFDNLARYGTAICFSQFNANYNGVGLETAYSEGGLTPYPRLPITGKNAVVNFSIHPANYFQDATANSVGRGSFKGFIDQWYIADLFKYLNNDLYNQDELKKAIDECKKGQKEEFWFGNEHGGDNQCDIRDFTRASCNPLRLWTYLRIEGNEDDNTIYYVEILNRHIIRCHPNDLDYNIIPLETGVYYPRPKTWWGNSNLEMKMAFQNLKNWLINAKVEDVMKASDRIILARRGSGLDVADINNRHQYGGFVFTDTTEPLNNLMFPVNFQSSNQRDYDWLNREINQMIQESSPAVNLMNRYNEGGMNNNTLGAAQMQAGMGEIMLSFPMKKVASLLNRVSEINARLLIQFFGDVINIRTSPQQDPQQLMKKEFLGEWACENKSTIFVNEQRDKIDKANAINQIINWSASVMGQKFQAINLDPFLRDWIRAWAGQGADLNEYIAPMPPMMLPQGGPQVPGMMPPPQEGKGKLPPQVNTPPIPPPEPIPPAPTILPGAQQ